MLQIGRFHGLLHVLEELIKLYKFIKIIIDHNMIHKQIFYFIPQPQRSVN